jgi:hypothetical protein
MAYTEKSKTDSARINNGYIEKDQKLVKLKRKHA